MTQTDDTHPDDTHPDDTRPDDTHPDDTHPDDTHPDDTHPDDTHPDDTPRDATASSDDQEAAAVADGDGSAVQGAGVERSGLFEDLTWPELRRKLQVGAITGLALLAAWATFQVYLSASRAIAIWLHPDFVPPFQAVFNAIVLVVAVAGILWIRRSLA